MNPSEDVCIVGGGPAGMTLALLLLRSGRTVTVLERTRSLDREYRGEILQPSGLAVLDRLGVLAGAKARGAYEMPRFQLLDRGRPMLDIDYRRLGGPHDHLLSIPQRHLLQELLDACGAYDGFTYLAGTRLSGLVRTDGTVTGVTGDGPDGPVTVRARLVVGADGRFSKTRRLAGLRQERMEVFDLDVLWFRLAHSTPPTGLVRIFRGGGNAALAYDSFPGTVQVGWTLPHKGYQALAQRGVAHVKASAAAILPEYAELIEQQVTALSDLTLLDVFAGKTDRWATDGLVLIGDAAHTHSPLGAQGINLAIQDAVVAHPVLLSALDRGDVGADALAAFQAVREPDIDAVMKFQVMQSKGMFSTGRVAGFIRPRVAPLIMHTPIGSRLTRHIALGNPSIRIHDELFAAA